VFAKKIGIDLGSSSVRVYLRGEGIVVDEPSLAAIDVRSGRLVGLGGQAREAMRRTPRRIRLVRPVRAGAIADLAVVERVLQHLVTRAQGRQRLFRPEVVICVHAAATGDDRRALTQAAMSAGARQAWLIEAPMADAMGIGLPVAEAAPHAVCDIGGGTTQVAVISLSGVVAAQTDEAIATAVQRRHGVAIDAEAAEAVKLAVGAALPGGPPRAAEATGRGPAGDLAPVTVTSAEVSEAIQPPLRAIAATIRSTLEQTPSALAAQLEAAGLHLAGGGALLAGIDRYLARATGLMVTVAEDPRTCAVRGTRRALGEYEVLQRRQHYMR